MEHEIEVLIDRIHDVHREPDIVCMHDFMLDHFAVYQADHGTLESYLDNIAKLARQGGGVIPYNYQYIKCGGNAYNSAITLANLGANAHIICKTSPLGLNLMKFFAKGKSIDFSHVTTDGELAITIALELKYSEVGSKK